MFGVPDDRLGEAVAAVIVLEPGASMTADELTEFLSTHIAKHKIPSTVWFRDTPLVNIAEPLSLTLTRQANGSYQHNDQTFFPFVQQPIWAGAK